MGEETVKVEVGGKTCDVPYTPGSGTSCDPTTPFTYDAYDCCNTGCGIGCNGFDEGGHIHCTCPIGTEKAPVEEIVKVEVGGKTCDVPYTPGSGTSCDPTTPFTYDAYDCCNTGCGIGCNGADKGGYIHCTCPDAEVL